MASDSHPGETVSRGRVAALWLMVTGPLLVAFAQQQVTYTLVEAACRTQMKWLVHLPVLPALGLVFVTAALARRQWNASSDTEPGNTMNGTGRAFAIIGMAVAGLAAVVIVAQWLPTMFLDPCQR